MTPAHPTTSRYAVCQTVLRSGDIATDFAWAESAGAAAIGLPARVVRAAGVPTISALLRRHELTVSTIERVLDPILALGTGKGARTQLAQAVALCADLGSPSLAVITGPLDDRGIREADRACTDWFDVMAPIAADAGVRLVLEPVHPLLRPVSYVHTLRHGAELTAARPGAGLLADTGHLWWDRHLADDLAELGEQIGGVQIDDIDGPGLADYQYRRVQLGDGVLPLAELVGAIEAAGYRGVYENEVLARVPREDRVAFVRTGGERLAAWLA